ncbi:hypothetical protein A2619_02985 [candidate division WWE3 bacterium RIFOXYD1_FULL_39_9]|uniref:DUF5658 domain-containing protein n=1 Tax=candidate division WWE3 bacterium RIFOXYD1_FULL_39_9 TaxID=1802649 RepID=A0A1F4XAC1_UNCKA|nr:MAG: hypothetical protein A2619_02985 [candidate division WWE3 bacterium RIFOXYD1_FULL_39_9]
MNYLLGILENQSVMFALFVAAVDLGLLLRAFAVLKGQLTPGRLIVAFMVTALPFNIVASVVFYLIQKF